MKHFIAYGNSRAGHDRAPVDVSDRTVRQMYAPPFLEAVRAGVRTAMECYIEVGGVPMVGVYLCCVWSGVEWDVGTFVGPVACNIRQEHVTLLKSNTIHRVHRRCLTASISSTSSGMRWASRA